MISKQMDDCLNVTGKIPVSYDNLEQSCIENRSIVYGFKNYLEVHTNAL